jgi:hypothetical protein
VDRPTRRRDGGAPGVALRGRGTGHREGLRRRSGDACPSRRGRHGSTQTTEMEYRHELRPVIAEGADIIAKVFVPAPRAT